VLIQFRVENHRSLREEQTLSLVASSLGNKTGAYVLRVEGLADALVPVVAIYGANASGKSNVLGALAFMRSAVRNSQRRWEVEGTPHDPFRLSNKVREPSLYEVDIVVGGVRFRYGFQLSAARVEEEWLFAWPHGRKAMWFEREGDRFEFGKTLHGENETIRNLTRSNSLFLSAAAQNNHEALLPIFHCFTAWRFSFRRNAAIASYGSISAIVRKLGRGGEGSTRSAILRLLQGADTGILDIRVERDESVQLEIFEAGQPVPASAGRPPRVSFRHRSKDAEHAWLPLTSESAGTKALLELAPDVVDALRDGALLCIDELEASLHPTLALAVVRMFNDAKLNPNGAQLVFATHDTNLLGSIVGEPALRRDQIWFTEKDDGGGTHLYPLTDFHPRKEENLERGYLQGRYGAVPFLGDLLAKPDDEPGA
jgi:uncharacterized protein